MTNADRAAVVCLLVRDAPVLATKTYVTAAGMLIAPTGVAGFSAAADQLHLGAQANC